MPDSPASRRQHNPDIIYETEHLVRGHRRAGSLFPPRGRELHPQIAQFRCFRIRLIPVSLYGLAFLGNLSHLHALKGVGNRAFHRWLTRDYRPLFPRLPERTRLFRLFKTHQDWTRAFLAAPTALGVIDTYGIELI